MQAQTITTPLTKMLGIKNPVFLAGMNVASGPELCAAVSNAGGIGSIGGLGYSPNVLKKQIEKMKTFLNDPNLPFGIDLALPQIGGSARKTNKDYTNGQLPELLDVIIESKAALFISAVGVPPPFAIKRLHDANIVIMNMVGARKHAEKAIQAGVDIICAQGGEGGGHTGDIPTSILIPAVVDVCKGHFSKLTGDPIYVVAAGGIYDGRGLAMALGLGAQAVWVGTRFVNATEAGAPQSHQQGVIDCDFDGTIKTLVYSGRPLRAKKNAYIMDYEVNRREELMEMMGRGVVPIMYDFEKFSEIDEPTLEQRKEMMDARPFLMGEVAALINDVKPAKDIVEEMVSSAIQVLKSNVKFISKI